MRRFIAIGASTLIVGLALSFCCLAQMPESSCCRKGHCAMAGTSSPVIGVAPMKTVAAYVVTSVVPLRIIAAPPVAPATTVSHQFNPVVTTELRI